MVQLKIILDTRRKKSDGSYPIMFRVTNSKQVNYLSFGFSIEEQEWDDKNKCISSSHPNSQSLNISLSKKFYEIQKAVLALEENDCFSISALKQALIPQKNKVYLKKEVTFLEFSNQVIEHLIIEERIGNAIVYQTAVNRIIGFCNNKLVKFEDINYTFLDAFKRELTLQGAKVNTVGNYLRSIRAIYNKAIKAKIVDRSYYPFSEIQIKSAKTAKRAISIHDLQRLHSFHLILNSKMWHARNYFLLSFYMIGISFTDLVYLKAENIIKGRVVFRRRKTHKEYTIKVLPQAQNILDYYQKEWNIYLLPVLPNKVQQDSVQAKKYIHQWIKTTNKYLKRLGSDLELDSPLTTYVARHTWATTAKRLGYSNEIIAEALGHEYGNAVTNIYLDKFDQDIIDKVNMDVAKTMVKE